MRGTLVASVWAVAAVSGAAIPQARAGADGSYTTSIAVVDGIGDVFLVAGDLLAADEEEDTDGDGDVDDNDISFRGRDLAGLLLIIAGAGTIVVMPPLIHLGHDEVGRSLADLGLRIALPYGALRLLCDPDGSDALCKAAVFGGLLAAEVFDWVYLSRPDAAESETARIGLMFSSRF